MRLVYFSGEPSEVNYVLKSQVRSYDELLYLALRSNNSAPVVAPVALKDFFPIGLPCNYEKI